MAMKTMKNISAVVVVPFLSMIFLALPARAFLTGSNGKTHHGSDPDQAKVQSTPLVNYQQPNRHYEQPNQLQPPSQQVTSQQATRQQSSPKTQSTQGTHRDRGIHRDHDHDHDKDKKKQGHHHNDTDHRFRRPILFFNYGNFIPVRYDARAPALSAYVDSLPVGYLLVILNGITYAVYQDVFYQQTSSGYVVVDPTELISDESFSIGIPNSRGGYTTIHIEVVDNGFIGPQGEFYSQFPSIRQLQILYVR
jgi:hypothetical protein